MEVHPRRLVVMESSTVATAMVIDTVNNHDLRSVEFVFTADTYIFVARGEVTYRFRGHEGRLVENTLVSIPPGFRKSSLSADREMYVVSARDERMTAQSQRAYMPFFERRLSAEAGKAMHATMRSMVERTPSETLGPEAVAHLKDSFSPFFWRRSGNVAQSALGEFFESLWQRLSDPLQIAHLARELGYTANYLSDLVREHTGQSAAAWIAEMRMARARALLEHTDEPVAMVGERCGYDDPAYFARTFRRMHGVPPMAWRLAARPLDPRHSAMTLSIEAFSRLDAIHLAP
jgi:AraC-like DNA-binding protein